MNLKAALKTALYAPLIIGGIILAVLFVYFAGAIIVIAVVAFVIYAVYNIAKEELEANKIKNRNS